jgi:3-oxoacyl-[acyl-carrier-protein] synthase III
LVEKTEEASVPRIIRIKGIGVADKSLLRSVSNEDFAARLAEREPELRAYWFGSSWFRTIGYRSEGCRWLRETYEPKFAENNGGRLPDIGSDDDWAKLWEYVSAEVRAIPRWLAKTTRIRNRLEALPHVATTDLMASAGEYALKVSGLPREEVDGLFAASVSTDHPQTPPMSSLLQHKLRIPYVDQGGLRNISYVDGEAACCSFLAVLRLAVSALRSGECRSALVFGGDVMSRMTSLWSRTFGSLMGDHAGALHLVAEEGPEAEDAFPVGRSFFGYLDGSQADLIKAHAGGSRMRTTPEMLTNPLDQSHLMRMDGSGVAAHVQGLLLPGDAFDQGRATLFIAGLRRAGCLIETAEQFTAALNSLDLIVFHQANGAMVEEQENILRNRFRYSGEFFDNIATYANTTGAANLLCLYEAWVAGKLRKGMRVMVVAFGGGFTGMTCVLNWNLPNYVPVDGAPESQSTFEDMKRTVEGMILR